MRRRYPWLWATALLAACGGGGGGGNDGGGNDAVVADIAPGADASAGDVAPGADATGTIDVAQRVDASADDVASGTDATAAIDVLTIRNIGAACTGDPACPGGRCARETENDGTPTGFLGGYCYSDGTPLGTGAYQNGGALPRSGCPADSVLVPAARAGGGGADAGAGARCMKSCTRTDECRTGYACAHDPVPGVVTLDGFCAPADCLFQDAGCPAPYSCYPEAAGPDASVGVCG